MLSSFVKVTAVAAVAAVASMVSTAAAAASNVVVLTPENFDEIIDGSTPALVEFYAPWCGHCKTLAPIYEQVADAFAKAKTDVIVAKVDADAHRDLGSRFGVTGFPTLKWFSKGDAKTPEAYSSGRDLDALVDFIEGKTGIKAIKPKAPKVSATVLSSANFDEVVLDKGKNVLVEFYAPWCGHCKSLAPIYEKVAANFESESDCIVAQINAEEAKDISAKYGIDGFPTLKFFAKGSDKNPIDYTGGRTEKDLVEFLNAHCGTHRRVGGGLLDTAGRIAELDTIAREFSSLTTKAARADLYNQAKTLADEWISYAANKKEEAIENLAVASEAAESTYQNVKGTAAKQVKDTADTAADAYASTKEKSAKVGKDAAGSASTKYAEAKSTAADLSAKASIVAKDAATKASVKFSETTDAAKKSTQQANKDAKKASDQAASAYEETKDKVVNAAKAAALKASKAAGETGEQVTERVNQAIDDAKIKYAKYYIKVMDKINSKENYVEEEIARLSNIIKSGSIAGVKLDDFTTRQNILKVFRKVTGGEDQDIETEEVAIKHEEL